MSGQTVSPRGSPELIVLQLQTKRLHGLILIPVTPFVTVRRQSGMAGPSMVRRLPVRTDSGVRYFGALAANCDLINNTIPKGITWGMHTLNVRIQSAVSKTVYS
jgi:hypothetical protein